MLDLTKKSLPNVININGRDYSIQTDFRVWLCFFRQLKNARTSLEDFNVSYLFKNDMPPRVDINALVAFAMPPRELPRDISGGSSATVIDYDIDADLIYAAFLGQYGIDLLTVDMHWYVFSALLNGLNDTTKMREVMGYRSYEKSNDKDRDMYEELRKAWEIAEDTFENDEELEEFSRLFTKE